MRITFLLCAVLAVILPTELLAEECEGESCPVNGGWSRWSSWTTCKGKCGVHENVRQIRTCTHPKPQNGGLRCEGDAAKERECPFKKCKVAKWGRWCSWSTCTKKCGGGESVSRRKCHGGKKCKGVDHRIRRCNSKPCPIDGHWGKWGGWCKCSRTCGSGEKSKRRRCNHPKPQHGGKDCEGDKEITSSCQLKPCPVDGHWGSWGSWCKCTKTCGGGTKTRRRKCNGCRHGGKKCKGKDTDEKPCAKKACPVDGKWSKWCAWSKCSATCGHGLVKRHRRCDDPKPAHGGKKCKGDGDEEKDCPNKKPCQKQVDGKWGFWKEWSKCDRTCGEGLMTRTRKCNQPAPKMGGKQCAPPKKMTKKCSKMEVCPVDGRWGEWAAWSKCTNVCGGGTHKRSRKCDSPKPNGTGKDCQGNAAVEEACGVKNITQHDDVILLRNMDMKTSFDRSYQDYVDGFGDIKMGNYWIGLNAMYCLTKAGPKKVSFTLYDWNDEMYDETYNKFQVGAPASGFQLTIGKRDSRGKLGYAYTKEGYGFEYQNNMKFSAKDKDQDLSGSNCAVTGMGGWWYNSCSKVKLTGLAEDGKADSGIQWQDTPHLDPKYSFKKATMTLKAK